tara:strand:+ start:1985 stop:2200 length:216 start_codon:yes stop_codon:yes gene_type:complete
MPRYKITTARFDVPTETYKEFDAADDDAAKKEFEELAEKPELAFETMFLKRIDAPAVPEKTTILASAHVRD